MATVTPPSPKESFKPLVSGLVKDWAATLTPQNAPKQAVLGPLAWVRGEKVAELLQILEKAGYK